MSNLFSIGEYVARRMDGKVGKVMRMEPNSTDIPGGDWIYYVQFDPRDKSDDNPDGTWAGTEAAWQRRDSLHAHVETESQDCDGRYTSGRVEEMTLQERCDQFGDLHFKERVLANVVSLHAEQGTLTVTEHGLEWREQTEEGYRATDVEWCEDDCSEERPWQRDHRAEAMGY